MKMIKIVIVLTVLSGLSFAASYLFSANKPALAQVQAPLASQPAEAPVTATSLTLLEGAKEQQLDDLAKELRRRLEECKRRQDDMDLRDQRLNVAQESLKKRADDLEAMRLQLVGPLAQLRDAQKQLESNRLMISQQEKTNIKRTAAIYEKMEPAKASRILTDMCGGTQEDDAARILFYMSERTAAKVLAEMADKGLAAQLCDRLKRIQEES